MQNLAGRINYYAQQARPTDPLEAFRARHASASSARGRCCRMPNRRRSRRSYGEPVVLQYTQFYGASGGGG